MFNGNDRVLFSHAATVCVNEADRLSTVDGVTTADLAFAQNNERLHRAVALDDAPLPTAEGTSAAPAPPVLRAQRLSWPQSDASLTEMERFQNGILFQLPPQIAPMLIVTSGHAF